MGPGYALPRFEHIKSDFVSILLPKSELDATIAFRNHGAFEPKFDSDGLLVGIIEKVEVLVVVPTLAGGTQLVRYLFVLNSLNRLHQFGSTGLALVHVLLRYLPSETEVVVNRPVVVLIGGVCLARLPLRPHLEQLASWRSII